MAIASQDSFSNVVSRIFWPVWVRTSAHPRKVGYYVKKFSKTFAKAIKNVPEDFQASVAYWKDFIRGIPEYDLLIKSGQIEIVQNILNALAYQSEVLKYHQERIKALEEALRKMGIQISPMKQMPDGKLPLEPPPNTITSEKGKRLTTTIAGDVPLYSAFFTLGAFQGWLDERAGAYLHELIGKGAESPIIDAAFGIGHRLKEGHDLTGLIDITKAKGVDGAATWFQHMFADLMSPHGIPLPGATYVHSFLKETIGLSEKFLIDWTCVSATDIVTGGLSLLILARMHHIATEEKRISMLATLTIGQIILIALIEANPFFLATIPIQVLLARHEWRKMQLRKISERLVESKIRVAEARKILEKLQNG